MTAPNPALPADRLEEIRAHAEANVHYGDGEDARNVLWLLAEVARLTRERDAWAEKSNCTAVELIRQATEQITAERDSLAAKVARVEAWEAATRRAAESIAIHSESDSRECGVVMWMLDELRAALTGEA